MVRADQLEALGWQTLVVWQCETGDIDTLTDQLLNFVENPRTRAGRRILF